MLPDNRWCTYLLQTGFYFPKMYVNGIILCVCVYVLFFCSFFFFFFLVKILPLSLFWDSSYCFLLLTSVPLYVYGTVFVHSLLVDVGIVSTFWPLQIKLLWTITSLCLCGCAFDLLGKYLKEGCLGLVLGVCRLLRLKSVWCQLLAYDILLVI